jgi:phage baseplate assembly protein W
LLEALPDAASLMRHEARIEANAIDAMQRFADRLRSQTLLAAEKD